MGRLTIGEIGRRVKIIRDEGLDLNQSEFSEKVNTKQVILSRLENGKGAAFDTILNIVNYLNALDYNGWVLFAEEFDINNLKGKKQSDKVNNQQAKLMLESLKAFNEEQITKLIVIMEAS